MDEFSEQLICKVQTHPYLYDDQHKEYKNLNAKEQTWRKIGEELKMSPIKVKARWKNLRDSYVKYKNQLNKVRDNAEQEALNNRYLKVRYLTFLDETLARRSLSHAHVKPESSVPSPPMKRPTSYDNDLRNNKKAKTERVKKKSSNKIRSTLNALTTKRRHEKPYKKEAQPIEESAPLVHNAKVESFNISPENCLEISTTNGMATKDGTDSGTKSNYADLLSNHLEDKRQCQAQIVSGGSDAVDHLFSSYAHTFRTLPLRQQVNIKVEMAKLFALAEIESLP
ncbi:PREDICTED: uncharacterized protein LOC108965392 [Bactrocera latifrons]|uniref:Transcription factor Adf-1 n=1 Tax=Bactrocera latifrons TaxID=174628 RepID=A0A0K8WD71_BACLA|nr:PREDICTED: uncharacterized protein LOC108965392 [Bactrocera latifrons]